MMIMQPKRIAAPTEAVVSLAEAKAYCNVEHADDDAVIAGLIEAATDKFDGYHGTLNGFCLMEQQWRFFVPHFCHARLPLKPLKQIDTVTYFDVDGVSQGLASTEWRALEGVTGAVLALPDDKSWPQVSIRQDAVVVTATFGHASAGEVPEKLRLAIMMLVSGWYEKREAVSDVAMSEVPLGVRVLTEGFRMRIA